MKKPANDIYADAIAACNAVMDEHDHPTSEQMLDAVARCKRIIENAKSRIRSLEHARLSAL